MTAIIVGFKGGNKALGALLAQYIQHVQRAGVGGWLLP